MRKLVIGSALGATLLACWFAPDDDSLVIAPARASVAAPETVPAPAPAPHAVLPDIHLRGGEEDPGNVFATRSWEAAAPVSVDKPAESKAVKPVTARSPSPAQAGEPIRLLGRYADEGKQAYFLQIDGRDVVAYVGERIDERYSFDGADAGILTFTHLQTNKQHTVAIEETH